VGARVFEVWDGSMTAIATVTWILSVAAFEWLALRRRWGPYFQLGLPLGREMVPLLRAPASSGESQGLRWEWVAEQGFVRFWGTGGGAPRGLHGVVWLHPDARGRMHLVMRWAPPLLLPATVLALVVVGIVQREGVMMGPLAAGLGGVVTWAHWQLMEEVATRLRWSLASTVEEDEEQR
jgi:hypothetical protein